MSNIYILIGAIFTAPFLGVLVDKIFSRRANQANINNVNVVGEKTALEMYREYTKDIKTDFDKLKQDFKELSDKFDVLSAENRLKDQTILNLQNELAVYKKGDKLIDSVTDTLHTAIDQ